MPVHHRALTNGNLETHTHSRGWESNPQPQSVIFLQKLLISPLVANLPINHKLNAEDKAAMSSWTTATEDQWNNTDRGEVLQHLTILLLAPSEAPLGLVQEAVEVLQQRDLHLQRDAHVVLHCVQGPQHQVEDAHSLAGEDRTCEKRRISGWK